MDNKLRRLQELGNEISHCQNVMLLSTRFDPLRARCIQRLAMARFERYALSKQQDDLKQSILRFTEAILLPLPSDNSPLNIVEMLYFIALAYFRCAEESRHPEDIKCCIMYLRYLHGQCRETLNLLCFRVTEILVCALAVQVKLELGDAVQDVEEMADLCHELLNSDISIESLTEPIMAFAAAIDTYLLAGFFAGQYPSENVIGCLRKANMRLPDLHGVSIVLGDSLLNRFRKTRSGNDYEEGLVILDKIIASHAPGYGPSPYQEAALWLAATFAQTQFGTTGKPEHLEQSIYRYHTLLDKMSLEDPSRLTVIRHLSHLRGRRFNNFSLVGNVQDGLSSNIETPEPPPFQDLTPSLAELNAVKSMPMTTLAKHFDALRVNSIERLADIAEIKDGVKYCRQLLTSYPGSILVPFARKALGHLLRRAFSCTNEIEYLNEAISVVRDNFNTPEALEFHLAALQSLISLLSTRVELSYRREDLDELMELFPIASNYRHAGLLHQFPLSFQWASIARHFRHPSASTAYDCAMASMQASLTFAPTLDVQHSRLVSMRNDMETLPLDYASYQIHSGRLKQAIRTLEQGRGLLWSEMRGLRTSIDQIRLVDSDTRLTDKFVAVNKDIETLTLAFSQNDNVDGKDSGAEGIGRYAHLVEQKQKLLDDREALVSQIQALPDLDTFFKPPSFDALHCAALGGPVIIINHCKWRSDMLILLHNSPPSLITTSHDFYARANKLQALLLGARKKGLDSGEYEDALRFVLKDLFELVGQPVIKRLDELNIPEQSRIWWYPTSVFCSLPLHAMGPIPSEVGPPRYFLDLYISSYTPSLSALMESRKPSSQTFDEPSMLLVLQPDPSIVEALGEMRAVQAVNISVTTLIGATATPTAVLERLQNHQFAHVVCHGILESGKPFDSSFKLYNGKRLSLLDIVRSRLPNAEFAFLAACHTAELTEESPADEALHLSAAMQYCGFRSVVGTMWAMADTDGCDLAKNFYKSVFSVKGKGIRYYERTAEALRDAVVKLRRKRGKGMTLERWVNYVHYGA